MTPFIFEARNISRSFGVVRALEDVSLGIRAGELHAIIGENGAGKSTLMNIFCGRFPQTAGDLLVDGKITSFHSPHHAQAAGIAIAPQEISLVPRLTVAENIHLGNHLTRTAGIDWRRTNESAAGFMRQIDDTINLNARTGDLSKAQQQLVQIARATSNRARILIFDEPTASLTYRETEKLFAFIRRFRDGGGAVFYISHRLDEILALSDRISVLRDGNFVGELDPRLTSKTEMVRLMAGRATSQVAPDRSTFVAQSEIMLSVKGLSRPGEFEDISFDLHKGEILGVSGLIGSGRTELAKCIFGLTRASSGTVELGGRARRITSPADAIALGLVYLPEERKQEGIFPLLSIAENMALPNFDRFRGILHLRTADITREVDSYVKRLRIKLGVTSDPIVSLSGGNQQKVIIARWLMNNAKILIMDEPTRGIDVNAKFEIRQELRRYADDFGLSIIFISSELEEVLDVSDRIIVMHEKRIKGVVTARQATQESLLQLAMT